MQDKTPPQTSILKQSIHSGKWLSIGYAVQKALGFVSFLILARLLPPEAFGMIALILLIPKFLEATTETGLPTAIIQRQGDVRQFLNPIWTIGIIKALFITVVVAIFGRSIAAFYGIEEAALAVQLGGLMIIAMNLSNIGETYLFRNLEFKKIVIRNCVRDATYIIVSLSIAYASPTYWALFWGTLASFAAQSAATYALQPYRPRLTAAFGSLRELLAYSKWIVGQGWIAQITGFLETSVVAKSTSAAGIGLYTKAKSLASVAPGFLGPMIRHVSFPAYAKIQEERDKIVTGLLHTFHIVSFFLIPITIGILFAGGKLILIFLGEEWLGMTGAFRVLLPYFFITVVADIAQPFFNAVGRPDTQVKLDLAKLALTTLLIIPLTLRFGIVGSAFAVLGGALPSFFLNLRAMIRLTDLGLRDIVKTILVPMALSALVFAPFIIWKEETLAQPYSLLLLFAAISGIVYLLLTYTAGRLWQIGPFQTIQVIMKHVRS